MADMTEIIDAIGAAIAADADIEAWCQTNYDKSIVVSDGWDGRDMPLDDNCPLVIIWKEEKSGGRREKYKSHVFGLAVIVYDDTAPAAGPLTNIIRFQGCRNVEDLRQLVFSVVENNVPSGLQLDQTATVYDDIEQFPYASATMTLVFNQMIVLGIGQSPHE